MRKILLASFFAISAMAGTPLIYNRGVLNAASSMPVTLAGGAIAQGSIFSIVGAGLAAAPGDQQGIYPLSTTLAGVSVTVTQGSTTVKAIPLYVTPGQIDAIMPSNAPVGTDSLRVVTSAGQSNAMPVIVSSNSFGIFTANGTGLGPAVAQNFVASSDQPVNSPTTPAKPGQNVTLWGTGLGPVANDAVAPSAGNLPAQVQVSVGGIAANVVSSGRASCCAGLDQVVIQVPATAPVGCWVPVSVSTGGSTVSNFATIAITADGSSCFSAAAPAPFVGEGNYGSIVSLRVDTYEDVGLVSPLDVTGDYSGAVAYSVPASEFPFHPVFSYPPAGACTEYAVAGDVLRGEALPAVTPIGGTILNLGSSLTLSGTGGSQTIPSLVTNLAINYLGGSVTGNLFPNTLFLQPGAYQVSAPAGNNVGSVSATGTMPQPLTWTNRAQIVTVNRSQPLSLTWSGGSANQIMIIGVGEDLPTNSTTIFGCLAAPGANSFTVPAGILSNVPATRTNPLQSKSVLYLVNAPDLSPASQFSATGLSAGLAAFLNGAGKTVIFQ